MEQIFSNVMLEKIKFIDNRQDIQFEFYDSENGNDLGKVICKNIFLFNCHTAFEPNEDSFPCFVLDVNIHELENDDIVLKFKKYIYEYGESDKPIIPKSEVYHLLKIEGGPIDITVICERIEFNKV
ncbi:hypothetical protein [Paenibacillus sp. P36]|uniref:hypothetical protein n=1 Tax=Paenibacillus sp. P36 TaxID=3342538 RepID=UPI0038B39A85